MASNQWPLAQQLYSDNQEYWRQLCAQQGYPGLGLANYIQSALASNYVKEKPEAVCAECQDYAHYGDACHSPSSGLREWNTVSGAIKFPPCTEVNKDGKCPHFKQREPEPVDESPPWDETQMATPVPPKPWWARLWAWLP